MATRPILVDTTRLLTRLRHPAPTGIDRVDLAYARHFLRGQAQGRAVAITSFGTRLLPGRALDRLFDAIESRWIEGDGTGPDPILARLAPRLGLSSDTAAGERPGPNGRSGRPVPLAGLLRQVLRPAHGAHWRPAAAASPNAIYLHTSHLRLDRPALFEWLATRPDIRPVFFVHDLIPIEYPEYGVPGEEMRHRVRMRSVSRHAAAVIVSSRDVAERLEAYLKSERLRVPAVTVAPIGVEPSFATGPRSGSSPEPPYFVVCSTIEARKNHLTLLLAWRELALRLGSETPTLVVVGRRGWESENVVDLLDRSPAIRAHVVEAAGLSTPALVTLLRGARALLMPSFAEGYGIPVVEALALGTPVIASDLPVHREIAGEHATFLQPLDGLGWRDAVAAATVSPLPRPTGFVAPRWDDHFRIVEGMLAAL